MPDLTSYIVVVVDPFSSGKYYFDELLSRNLKPLIVHSRSDIPDVALATAAPHHSFKKIINDGDFSKLLNQVKVFQPLAVIAGSEMGVSFADKLSESLGLRTNGTEDLNIRRNKFSMIEAIRKKNLRAAKQYKAESIEDLLKWISQERMEFPVIIKPLESCGTDCVSLCSTSQEVNVAFNKIKGRTNQLGILNNYVLCQEYLVGEEYVVDTVSFDSSHYLNAFWKYQKDISTEGNIIYKTLSLIDNNEEHADIISYTFNALDALNIKNGPAHSEVMLTKKGPVLVESGARPNGYHVNTIAKECLGVGQIGLSVDIYTNQFKNLIFFENGYQPKKYAKVLCMENKNAGYLSSEIDIKKLKNLSSFFSCNFDFKEGDFLPKTVDLFTCAGMITLIHESQSVIENEFLELQRYEEQGLLYKLAFPYDS